MIFFDSALQKENKHNNHTFTPMDQKYSPLSQPIIIPLHEPVYTFNIGYGKIMETTLLLSALQSFLPKNTISL